jgi:signal transduction histidine kinase
VDIKSVSRRGVALAAAVLTVGLTAGAAVSTSLALAERDASTAGLALRTASVRSAVDTSFQRYADTMHDLVAAAATQPAGTLAPTVARLVGDRLDGAHQVLVVTADRRITAQHALDGSTPPAAGTLSAEPELDRALTTARDFGRLVASPAHVLPADKDLPPAHRQRAFELVEPVHTDDGFLGWVIVSVRAGDLLEQSLRSAGVSGVAAELAEVSPDGVAHDVAGWSADSSSPVSAGDETVDVALAGHAWQIEVRPTGDLVSPGRAAAAWLTLLAVVLFSLVMAGIVVVLDAARVTAGRRARRAVEERIAETERARRAEQSLHDREAELIGFAGTAGENLRAPLHTIAGYTDLLLEETGPGLDEASRGFLDRIGHSTRRMLGVVDELLAYTSATDAALKLEPVETQMLALDVAASVAFESADRPSVDVGELPLVSGDAELLREVLRQLIDNAVRFVRHGTPARVSVSAEELPSGWYRFQVADRGIGVPQGHGERIFAPFHRAPSAEGYAGSGLGLAVCKRIVARHGGEIGVTPNPGGGSIFWFTISADGLTLSPDDLAALAAV